MSWPDNVLDRIKVTGDEDYLDLGRDLVRDVLKRQKAIFYGSPAEVEVSECDGLLTAVIGCTSMALDHWARKRWTKAAEKLGFHYVEFK